MSGDSLNLSQISGVAKLDPPHVSLRLTILYDMSAVIYGLSDVLRDFYLEATKYTDLHAPKEDLSGKVIIVTGATAGLGKESVRQLALMNPAKIIMTGRNVSKGKAVQEELVRVTGFKNIVLEQLDLNDFASINACSKRILGSEKKIDVLMCNAGVGQTTEVAKKTVDGFDEMYLSLMM